MTISIKGFDHGNRGAGIRNHQLILPTVVCSTHVSRRIATEVGAVTFAHQHGCGIIGDDVNDLAVMKAVGLAICPSSAVNSVKTECHIILSRKGGDACVREFIDQYLLPQGI